MRTTYKNPQEAANFKGGIVSTKPQFQNYQRVPEIIQNSASKSPAFTGGIPPKVASLLTNIGKLGDKPIVPMVVGTAGTMLFRIPIILSDKKTPEKERNYTAAWTGVSAALCLITMFAVRKHVDKFAEGCAEKLLKNVRIDKFKEIEKLKLIKDKLMDKLSQDLSLKDKSIPNMLNKAAKKGAAALFEFLSLIGILNLVNMGITRYLKRGINFLSQKTTGKPAKGCEEKQLNCKEQEKQKKIDSIILGSLITAGGLAGLSKTRFSPIKYFAKLGNILGESVKPLATAYNSLKSLALSPVKWLQSEKGLAWLIKQSKVDWTAREMGVNAAVRPAILLSSSPYAAASHGIKEGLSYLFVKAFGEDKLLELTGKLTKDLKPEVAKGVNTIINQSVRNIGIIVIAMGLLSVPLSRKLSTLLKGLQKEGNEKKPETNNQEQTKNNIQKSAQTYPAKAIKGSAPVDMQVWLKSIQNKNNLSSIR